MVHHRLILAIFYSKLKTRLISILPEVFHVYLNKFEIAVSYLFFIIFTIYKFTLLNLIFRNAKKISLYFFAGLKESLKLSSQNFSV